MGIVTIIDVEKKLVINTITGEITDGQSYENFFYITGHPDFKPEFNFLADARGIVRNLVTAEGLEKLGQLSPFSLTSKRAYVITRGLERIYSKRYTQEKDAGLEFSMITDDMGKAMEWLIN